MPYIVEKDYVKGTHLTQDAAIGARILYVADTTHLTAGVAMTIYDDVEGIDPATGLRMNTESITPTSKTATTLVLPAPGLLSSYTAQMSGNLYQGTGLILTERVEFDIPIKGPWCKIAQIKIVQQEVGAMEIAFEVWEETPIYEGNRLEMHKNVIRRNIVLTAIQGGWYGESLVSNLILYKDRVELGAGGQHNLHCALVNEAGGTASDFHVLFKIAEIGEVI